MHRLDDSAKSEIAKYRPRAKECVAQIRELSEQSVGLYFAAPRKCEHCEETFQDRRVGDTWTHVDESGNPMCGTCRASKLAGKLVGLRCACCRTPLPIPKTWHDIVPRREVDVWGRTVCMACYRRQEADERTIAERAAERRVARRYGHEVPPVVDEADLAIDREIEAGTRQIRRDIMRRAQDAAANLARERHERDIAARIAVERAAEAELDRILAPLSDADKVATLEAIVAGVLTLEDAAARRYVPDDVDDRVEMYCPGRV
jgi:hypothetical protein